MKKKFIPEFKIVLLIILIGISGQKLFAQSGGLNLMVALPQGEFKENVDKVGFGVSGHFTLFKTGPSLPFTVGINAGYINYGNEKRTAPLSETIYEIPVEVNRTNNLVNFHLLFQISPFNGPVKPYLDVLMGGNYLFTTSEVKSQGNEKSFASTTNQDDFSWSYGGGGLLIKLADLEPTGEAMAPASIWLDLKVRYLFGTEAEYLKEGSISQDPVTKLAVYQYSKSKTDLITIHLGIVAEFF
ncbi:MAG: hypothetical protein NTX22_11835 [Ignavibacteriales bacterium]|nr:hypothetical protein [Ignavibacteriales bacterium]